MDILKKISLIFMLLAASGFAFAKSDMFYNLNSSSSAATAASSSTSGSWGDQTAFNFMSYPVTKSQVLIGGSVAALIAGGIITAVVISNNKSSSDDNGSSSTPPPTGIAHIVPTVMSGQGLPANTSPEHQYQTAITFTNIGTRNGIILPPIRVSTSVVTSPGTFSIMPFKSTCLRTLVLAPQKSCDVYLSFKPISGLVGQVVSATVTMNYSGGSSLQSPAINTQETTVQPTTSPISLEYDAGVSDTLYTNDTYNQAKFVFENETADTMNLSSVTITNLTSPICKCGSNAIACASACTLNGGDEYTVSGTYQNTSNGEKDINIDFAGTNNRTGKPFNFPYIKNIFTVPYVTDHVAVRVIENDIAAHPDLYINAGCTGDTKLVTFSVLAIIPGTGVKSSKGTCSGSSMVYNTNTKITSGDVMYYPRSTNAGNRFYMSYAPFTAATQPVETPPGQSFIYGEFNYFSPAANQERLIADISYVNFMAIGARINMIGNADLIVNGTPVTIEDTTRGQIDPSLTTETIFNDLKTDFTNVGHGWQNAIVPGKNILVAPLTPYLDQDYYTTYVQALWNYWKTHPVKISVAELGTNYTNCVFTGQVVNNELVFTPTVPGGCPQYSPGTSGNNPDSVPQWSPGKILVDEAATDGTYLHFAQFNYCDITQNAGNFLCHVNNDPTKLPAVDPNAPNLPPNSALFGQDPTTGKRIVGMWGPNGTYRSVIGKILLSYMTVGFLPFGPNPTQTLSPTNLTEPAHKAIYFTDQYSKLLGLSSSVPPAFNVYASLLLKYFQAYTTSYGDVLKLDGTITFFNGDGSNNFPYAQPMTLNLY